MGSKRLTPGDAFTRWARLQPPPAPTATPERRDRLVAAIASAMGAGVASRERARVRTRVVAVLGAAAAGVVLVLGPAFAYIAWRDRAKLIELEVRSRVELPQGNAAPSRREPAGGTSVGTPLPAFPKSPPILEKAPGGSRARGSERLSGRGRMSMPDDPSDLGEQNRLFASAMRARERGDDRASARLLDEFIRKYPVSPLLQEAYVSRFRALQSAGERTEAALAARRYLLAWPDGYAVQEAREVAAGRASKGSVSSP